MKKFILGAFIVASVMVLAFSVNAFSWPWEKNVQNSPSLYAEEDGETDRPSNPDAPYVSANDCNADDVCEAQSIDTHEIRTNGLESGIGGNYLFIGPYSAGSIYGDSLGILGYGLPLLDIKSENAMRILANNILIGEKGSALNPTAVGIGTDKVAFLAYNGSGNAYACLDESGGLFRSNTRCR